MLQLQRSMDTTIFYFIYSFAHQSAWFDGLIVFFAVYFPYIVVAMVGIFLLFYRKSWKEFLIVFLTSGLAVFLATMLKNLFHTSRPYVLLHNIHPLFVESSFAFPSGHATLFSALAFTTFFLPASSIATIGRSKKTSYRFMLFALFIGLARIAAGVHFPTDILGGFVLGIATPLVLLFLLHFFKKVYTMAVHLCKREHKEEHLAG